MNPLTTGQIAREAEDAFWAKVVELCPHAKSGDLQGGAKFEAACLEAVAEWRMWNDPTVKSIAPPMVRELVSAEELASHGLTVEDADGGRVWLAVWADRCGWYAEDLDHSLPQRFDAVAFNESACFATHAEAQAWLYLRVEVSS